MLTTGCRRKVSSKKIILKKSFWPSSNLGRKPRTSHHRSPGGEVHKKEAFGELPGKGWRDGAIANLTNIGTFPKETPRTTLRDGGGVHMGFPEHVNTILNWTKPVETVQNFATTVLPLPWFRERDIGCLKMCFIREMPLKGCNYDSYLKKPYPFSM